MKRFPIGAGERGEISCDLSTLVDTRLLVQANSGGGKSWCLRRILEQTHGAIQHLVIDPEGEFASLRERFDYVHAAKHGGDTAADPRSAKLLAERLLELGVSAILDIYELKAHDRIRFVRHFLDTLVDAPKSLWHPALVIVDEAHVYCPQQGEAESAGAVIDLMTRGRKRGFCGIPATQRLSKLHKDAAAECNNRLIGRTGLDVDVKRAADDLGFAKDRWRELRDLGEGEFFAFGPALSRQVCRVKVGAVVTTHPKAGARLSFRVPPPTEKVRVLLPKLADLPAVAEKRQKDLADLTAENVRLKRELSARPKVEVPQPVVERVEVPAVAPAVAAMLQELVVSIGSHAAALQGVGEQIRSGLAAARQPAHPIRALRATVCPAPRNAPQLRKPLEQIARAAADNGSMSLKKGARRMLEALALRHPDPLTRQQVGMLASVRHTGGTFTDYLSMLRTRGLISEQGGRVSITPDGLAITGDVRPVHRDDILALWHPKLKAGARRMLDALVKNAPEPLTREELGELAGVTTSGGTFTVYLSTLKTAGLVVVEGLSVRAADDLV